MRGGIGSVLGAADTVTELTQDASARALELQASAEEVARSMDVLFQSVEKTSSSTTEMNASMNEMSNRTEVLAGIGDEVLSFVVADGFDRSASCSPARSPPPSWRSRCARTRAPAARPSIAPSTGSMPRTS